MKRKKPYRHFNLSGFTAGLLMLILAIVSCNNQQQGHEGHNTSVMSMNSDSMTGMKMPAKSEGHAQHDTRLQTDTTDETYWNTLPTNRTVIAKQEVVKPSFSDTTFSMPANGYITFDARRNRKIPVRVGGRIERLFVKYNYQYVHKGEKLLELYSPELNTYVEEYLYVRRNTNDSLLQKKAKEKLFLLGLSASQIRQINQSGNVSFTIPVYSPYEGYVLFTPSAPLSSMDNSGKASGMGSMGNASSVSAPLGTSELSDNSIREGMYVNKDQTLFWINDFKEVWGILAFNKDNEKYVSKGQIAVVTSEILPDQPFRSPIQFKEPVYQEGQKFSQARIYISNDKKFLKQNSLISANVFIQAKSLLLPASSVLYLGRIAIVWVQTGITKEGSYVFQSRAVKTVRRTGINIEILEGQQQNEAVAKDAAYLADSETIIGY